MNHGTSPADAGGADPKAPRLDALPAPAADKATDRRRALVGSLPDWEPLPPGEILVQRKPR